MKSLFAVLFSLSIFLSCSTLNSSKTEYAVDLVCGMKVDKSEAYTYKYNKVTYYFDQYACKETFKMNPEKFINNICVPPNDSIPTTEHHH